MSIQKSVQLLAFLPSLGFSCPIIHFQNTSEASSDVGKIVSLAAIDAQRVADLVSSLHQVRIFESRFVT